MATLVDVIERLREEGNLTRDNGKNSLKSLDISIKSIAPSIQQSIDSFLLAMPNLLVDAMIPSQNTESPKGSEDTDDEMPSSKKKERESEDKSLVEAISGSLEGFGKGLESLSDSMMDVVAKGAKGLGLAGLVMLFIKPEMMLEILEGAIDIFNDAIKALSDLMVGSTEGLEKFIEKNPVASTIAAGLLIIKTVSVIGGFIAAVGGLVSQLAIAWGAITTAFTWIATTVSLPMVAAAAAIGLAIYSVYKSTQDAIAKFRETDSYLEAFKTFLSTFGATLIGIPMNLVKSLVSMIAELFGADEFAAVLDEMDFVEILKEILNEGYTMIINSFVSAFDYIAAIPGKIMGAIKEMAGSVLGFLGIELPDIPEAPQRVAQTNPFGGPPAQETESTMSMTTSAGSAESATSDEPRYRIITTSGPKELTEAEIRQGQKDGTIKRSLASNKLRNIKMGVAQPVGKIAAESATSAEKPAVVSAEKPAVVSAEKPAVVSAEKPAVVSASSNEPRYNVMTKSGVKKLTKAEIQQGKKDGTIKRSFANDALQRAKLNEQRIAQSETQVSSGDIKPISSTTGQQLTNVQGENAMLTDQSEAEKTAAIAAAVSGGGQSSGGKSSSNVVSSTTNINKQFIPDNLSREFVFSPAG